MIENHFALIIASYEYQDKTLRQLTAPPQDAEALAQVLGDPVVGGFEVQTILNGKSFEVKQAIEAFFAERKKDDLLVLYFSGHGIKDMKGRLYLTTPNTERKLLRTSAIPAAFITDVMSDSLSRRQVVILDCCYSGAFAKGMVAKADKTVGIGECFEGRGRVVLTASDACQYAFEGENVILGEKVHSIFTRAMVDGLRTGKADLNYDGEISLDELYEYIYRHVTEAGQQQTPKKWTFDIQGEIIIARNPASNPFLSRYMVRQDWGTCDTRNETAIHSWLEEKLKKDTFEDALIIKDHGPREIADFIVIEPSQYERQITFYHCKAMRRGFNPGDYQSDAYEILGQAILSEHWISSPLLMEQLCKHTQPPRNSSVLKGDKETLEILSKSFTPNNWRYMVVIVQPGFDYIKISERKRVMPLFSAAYHWLRKCGAEFIIWGS